MAMQAGLPTLGKKAVRQIEPEKSIHEARFKVLVLTISHFNPICERLIVVDFEMDRLAQAPLMKQLR